MTDTAQLDETLLHLLRLGNRGGVGSLDPNGWVSVDLTREMLERRLKQPLSREVLMGSIQRIGWPLELHGTEHAMRLHHRRKRRWHPPLDVLYHATTERQVQIAKKTGVLKARAGRKLFFSTSESQAWSVAHRLHGRPMVLYVDAHRAQRSGVRFHRSKSGLYLTDSVPGLYTLNLHPGFKQQLSAGGMLCRQGEDGVEIALVRCVRRSRSTWEIAKGKLEEGETPQMSAIRELREEMGVSPEVEISIQQPLGRVRYGFSTPDGSPRLKSLYVFLMRADPIPEDFQPAKKEGILEIRWFPMSEVFLRVTHPSLNGILQRLRSLYG